MTPRDGALLRSLKRLVARTYLGALGWQVGGTPPAARKYVVICAPHTSNWDFLLFLAYSVVFDVRTRWLAKHTLFSGPLGWLMRRLGGIAVDRRGPRDTVATLARRFADAEDLVLAIAPEGTRGFRAHWKSGFYHIAHAAGVPIALGWLDHRTRTGGIGPLFCPTGDVRADMAQLRAFYADKHGRYPGKTSPTRLREEDVPAARTDGGS